MTVRRTQIGASEREKQKGLKEQKQCFLCIYSAHEYLIMERTHCTYTDFIVYFLHDGQGKMLGLNLLSR